MGMSRNLIDELEIEANHADFMASMAHMWMERARDAERALAVAVHAAGGEIIIHQNDLIVAPEIELWKDYRMDDMTVRLTTRRASTPLHQPGRGS